MINENTNNRRNNWSFPYKARMLLPHAQRRLDAFRAEETAWRLRMAELIQDPAMFHNDALLQQVKRDIDRTAGLREQFEVYVHEFVRLPEHEYHLGLSDVVFFGLLEAPR